MFVRDLLSGSRWRNYDMYRPTISNWFPQKPLALISPSDGWNEKDSYTYFKAQGSTKGLGNKVVQTFELNKGPSPVFHIRCEV